jgi:hypothetical protein
MVDNTTTIQSFLAVFNTPVNNPANAINTVMALFSPNAPTVGIEATLKPILMVTRLAQCLQEPLKSQRCLPSFCHRFPT